MIPRPARPARPAGSWHAEDDLMARYAEGTISPAEALSVEAHLLGCSSCRRLLTGSVPEVAVHRSWSGVADGIDRPRGRRLADLLDTLGVPETDVRIISTGARLHGPWCGALLGVLIASLVSASLGPDGLAEAAYLALAPIVPLLGLALAYGPRSDPLWEVSRVTPLPQLRVLLARSAALLAVGLPLLSAVGILGGAGPAVAASLLPALALTVTALVLGARLAPLTTATALAPAWITALGASLLSRGSDDLVETVSRSLVYRPATQAAFAVVTIAALFLTLLFRTSYDRREDLS